MEQRDISTKTGREIEGREQTHDLFIRPAVDIFETDEGITLLADLPGVSKEDLHVDIEQGLLTVQAKGKSYLSAEPIQREFLPGNFYRQFQLADIFDAEKISAEMKNGVLTLLVPKSEAAKPRHIEITAT
ncbi:MAG: Hsp20/alpha crystallin family protein [Desulfuromonadales bacterium]|nr:Hsp20/alpha crystallin family protein [Desulfuromonadales bacterium]